jgi:hypothetical protein
MEQLMIERGDLGMRESPERAQRRPGSIEGQSAIEHHPVRPEMIFRGITVQLVELKPYEARWNSDEKFCRETQRVSLIEQLPPHSISGRPRLFRRPDIGHKEKSA